MPQDAPTPATGIVVQDPLNNPFIQENGACGAESCHPDLLAALESQAATLGLSKVFVLTTRTAHWFQEQGFVQADLEQLPPKKQELYNFQRNSKVFVKEI